ncbi:MAG TPA: HlyC/CorC family transporter [Burkholderiaceae bacterium]|nr:HlyC/CorC family transporter [Burkholderiaceae bacterium]
MDELPLWITLAGLVVLLLVSAFFSISETALMALNRLRLRHLVREGHRAARRVQTLLDQTDKLLGTILLGNNLVNAAATALVTAMTIRLVGDNDWALLAATAAITFLILVFAEITPKVIGATFPEKIALPASYVLAPLLILFRPVVWFVNLFVRSVLALLRIPSGSREGTGHRLSAEELRTLVLEGGNFIPGKHRSILLNLFELEELSVDDVMIPRSRIEGIDLQQSREEVLAQLRTCYHNKLPAYDGDISRTAGVLLVRKLLPSLANSEFSLDTLRAALAPPYFVPSGTPLFQQLQHFQDTRQRIGLVVDEYGEVQGLLTLEDIIEEIVGEVATRTTASVGQLHWSADGTAIVDGSITLRDLNRRLSLELPLDGPKTLNGLLIERLEEIPDAPCCVRFDDVLLEVLHVDEHAVRSARVARIGAERDMPAAS